MWSLLVLLAVGLVSRAACAPPSLILDKDTLAFTIPPPSAQSLTDISPPWSTKPPAMEKRPVSTERPGLSAVSSRAGGGATTLPCGTYTLSAGSYEITSPLYPNNYPNNQDCTYSLDSGAMQMELTCPEFSVESHSSCAWDWLKVKHVAYCGTSGPPPTSGSQLVIEFHSDGYVTRPGYRCEILVQPLLLPSGSHVLTPGTYAIQSVHHPANYVNNHVSQWQLATAAPGDLISLSCDAFDVEWSSGCSYDWLEVDGARFCGTSPPAVRAVNALTATFETDYSVVASGFHCAVEVRSNTCCGALGGGGTRVIGGSAAAQDELPWQAALATTGQSDVWCGASLITDRHVLTAAHCVENETVAQLEVVLDEHDVTLPDDGEIRVAVSAIHVFPNYTQPVEGGDFALLTLWQPLSAFSAGVAPVCLPPASSLFSDAPGLVSGWGVTSYPGGSAANVLQKADVDIQSPSACAGSLSGIATVDGTMLCAQGAQGEDTCQGDSGGPLVVSVAGRAVLAGVTSFGVQCGSPQYPGVYARVTAALDWIAELTAGDVYCH